MLLHIAIVVSCFISFHCVNKLLYLIQSTHVRHLGGSQFKVINSTAMVGILLGMELLGHRVCILL